MDSHLLRIAGLIKKNSTGDISAREREELLQWKEKYPILQQWIENPDEKQEEIEQRLSQLLAEDILSDWKLIQKKVGQPSKSKKYYGIAAASILILMTLGFWIQNKQDRKSTRLNSSHVSSSYAVFCLKKKTTKHPTTRVN